MRSVRRIEVELLLRGQRVIFASGLTEIYGVETRVLNQAAKRNGKYFLRILHLG